MISCCGLELVLDPLARVRAGVSMTIPRIRYTILLQEATNTSNYPCGPNNFYDPVAPVELKLRPCHWVAPIPSAGKEPFGLKYELLEEPESSADYSVREVGRCYGRASDTSGLITVLAPNASSSIGVRRANIRRLKGSTRQQKGFQVVRPPRRRGPLPCYHSYAYI